MFWLEMLPKYGRKKKHQWQNASVQKRKAVMKIASIAVPGWNAMREIVMLSPSIVVIGPLPT